MSIGRHIQVHTSCFFVSILEILWVRPTVIDKGCLYPLSDQSWTLLRVGGLGIQLSTICKRYDLVPSPYHG